MPVEECRRRVTSREFARWVVWFRQRWNRPDRTDHYLALVATRVQQTFSKRKHKLSGNILKFTTPAKPTKLTEERKKEITANAKASWRALAGVGAGGFRTRQPPPVKSNDEGPGT